MTMVADMSVYVGLTTINDRLSALARRVEDTQLQAGSEGWNESLIRLRHACASFERSKPELKTGPRPHPAADHQPLQPPGARAHRGRARRAGAHRARPGRVSRSQARQSAICTAREHGSSRCRRRQSPLQFGETLRGSRGVAAAVTGQSPARSAETLQVITGVARCRHRQSPARSAETLRGSRGVAKLPSPAIAGAIGRDSAGIKGSSRGRQGE